MTKERTTVLKTPKRNEIHNWFIISDVHSTAMHEPTFNIFKKHAKKTPKKGRKLIINGDFLECTHLMGKTHEMKKWAKSVPKIEELIDETDIEIDWGNDFLDQVEKLFEEVVLIFGNHDYRYLLWLEGFCPVEYAHHFDIIKRLKLKERKIKTVNYPDYLDIGHLTFTHGYKHGQNHNDEMMKIVNNSIVYGHVHHFNCKSYAYRGASKRATSLPTLSNLSPQYQLKRGENNWSNGYGLVCMRSNGLFNLYVFEVWENVLVLPCGNVLHGTK